MSIFKNTIEPENNNSQASKIKWAWQFTKKLITSITIVYFICTLVEIILILIAIYQTGTFSFLDTFIVENNNTFRDVVCVNLVKSTLENIFKYNDFGGKIPSKSMEEDPDDDVYGN